MPGAIPMNSLVIDGAYHITCHGTPHRSPFQLFEHKPTPRTSPMWLSNSINFVLTNAASVVCFELTIVIVSVIQEIQRSKIFFAFHLFHHRRYRCRRRRCCFQACLIVA